MSKFIELTYYDDEDKFFLNIDCIECVDNHRNRGRIITFSCVTDNEEWYEVVETPAEIMAKIQEVRNT